MGFEQLKREQQRALGIVYGPRAGPTLDDTPSPMVEMIEGAKEVITIVDRILEAET